jgi:serine O-acetyltransferase
MNPLVFDIKRACREHKREVPIKTFEKLRIVVSTRGLKALMAFRLCCYINRCCAGVSWAPIKWLTLAATETLGFLIRVLYGIQFHNQARIGEGLFIAHFGGISIGKCQIGKHCSIAHQVSIGSMNPKSSETGPIIGDHVWIGAHAKIVGDVVIDSHSTIVSGSVVTSDVKKNTLVMGNPARVIRWNYDNRYLL